MASWREKLASEAGMTLKQYLKTDSYKQAKKSRDKEDNDKKSSDKGYKDIINSILKSTPAQNKTLDEFEKTYTPELEAEDYSQSEALYTPYFEQQIANELEDLNAWSEADSISYDRSLRRARFSMAAQGGAIGSERENKEGEMATDHEANVKNTVRGAERNVGTDKIVNNGYQSAGQTQEGSIVGKMKTAIQEGQLWYKNQRASRYIGNSETYYQQPSAYALDGSKL